MEGVWDSGRRASRNLRRSMSREMKMGAWGMEEVFARRSGRSASWGSDESGDEEALRWAAIEKLPTYDRLRTGILKRMTVDEAEDQRRRRVRYEHKEVDVRKLGEEEKKGFIDRVFKVAELDNLRFLNKLRNRIDRVGVQLPTMEVRFDNVTVHAKCHVGNRAMPTLTNTARDIFESALGFFGVSLSERMKLTILNNVSGMIKPARMTLLLGPPSSGKTTLLLALAGKLDSSLKVYGDITYNGYRLNEFVPQKTAAYVSQNDVHVAEMTVRETLDFSARCQGVGPKYDLLTELAKREKEAGIFPEAEVDLFMKATAMEGMESSLQTNYTLRVGIQPLDF
ncbi:putative ABC transporter, P-loop containing nucleoside triphosphate hydrolase [Dioscorea sansibarensis]